MGLAALIASCSDDDRNNDTDNQHLVSPSMAVSISNTDGRQSPFTGILTIMPCDANSSIYYGNYVKGKLSPFYGYYRVKDGSFHDNSINREISLPIGTYNMIYWGTPQYQTPIYAHPAIKEAAHSIGADMSQQSLGLFRMSADTIYYPVFDLVYATQPVNIGSESLSGSLKRVVAGIKVVLKDRFPDHLIIFYDAYIIFFRQLIQDFHELFIVHSETIALAVHAVYDLEWCDCVDQSHHTLAGTHPAELTAFFL